MSKCLNCDDNAVYILEKRGQSPQLFCEKDLPWFLKSALPAEGLKKISDLVAKEEPKIEEKPKKPSKKEEPVVVSEPEPVVEETVAEEEINEDRDDNN